MRRWKVALAVGFVACGFVACTGPAGKDGANGAPGPPGADGKNANDGVDAVDASVEASLEAGLAPDTGAPFDASSTVDASCTMFSPRPNPPLVCPCGDAFCSPLTQKWECRSWGAPSCFCGIATCNATNNQYECTAPCGADAGSFACGNSGLSCVGGEICAVRLAEGGLARVYSCVPMPADCVGNQTCQCAAESQFPPVAACAAPACSQPPSGALYFSCDNIPI